MLRSSFNKMQRGFTLLEVLATSGIIALLVGLALPVMSKARSTSRDIKCQSNLRSWGQGYTLMRNGLVSEKPIYAAPGDFWDSDNGMVAFSEYISASLPLVENGSPSRVDPYQCPFERPLSSSGVSYHDVMVTKLWNKREPWAVRMESKLGQFYPAYLTSYPVSADKGSHLRRSGETNVVRNDGSVKRDTVLVFPDMD